MVNNFDRIHREIRQRVTERRLAGISRDVMEHLLLNVVDLEDQHRRKSRPINKEVETMLRSVATQAQASRQTTPRGSGRA